MADGGLARQLERDAARHLADAIAQLNRAGRRDVHRRLLDQAVDLARRALDVGEQDGAGAPRVLGRREGGAGAAPRLTLARAYAARAEDALHGVGQLSLSAQRAPTVEACDDGWKRVAEIVASAEAFAAACASVVAELELAAPDSSPARSARAVACRAEAAAVAARAIVAGRNHAYTFHTDARFSFGEGWYLAAAAALAGVTIQVEPGRPGTAQAERFLRDAGLSDRVRPYRPRPRAMKHTTAVVGRAFRADPASAQLRLRSAFLGDEPIAPEVREWIDATLLAQGARPGAGKVLVWIRAGSHHPGRNTTFAELEALVALVARCGLVPVLTGDRAFGDEVPRGALDLILFWKHPLFLREDMRRAQLHFFEHLRHAHGLVGQLGVTTAGMDGPALLGLPTVYLTDAPNVRMREWVGAVPGYEEVVREPGYLERVEATLRAWRRGARG